MVRQNCETLTNCMVHGVDGYPIFGPIGNINRSRREGSLVVATCCCWLSTEAQTSFGEVKDDGFCIGCWVNLCWLHYCISICGSFPGMHRNNGYGWMFKKRVDSAYVDIILLTMSLNCFHGGAGTIYMSMIDVYLVGGLEQFSFFHTLGIIIPTG